MQESVYELPEPFAEAVRLFNAGEYFECHEVVEELWREESTSLRLFYQGILQVAVGCYHLTVRRNRHGALSKLRAGVEKLHQFPAVMGLIALEDLRQQVRDLLIRIEATDDLTSLADTKEPLLTIRYLA